MNECKPLGEGQQYLSGPTAHKVAVIEDLRGDLHHPAGFARDCHLAARVVVAVVEGVGGGALL